MRLGFWNRLALVLGIIGTFAFPTWWVLSTNQRHASIMESGYQRCLAAADERRDSGVSVDCFEAWLEPKGGYLGWDAWMQAVAGTAIGVLILYGLLWLSVWTARWVWRGREPQPVEKAE